MNNKSMVIRMREFLLSVESEKCDDLPWIQLQAKALRWDLEEIFKFPEDTALTPVETNAKKLCGSIDTCDYHYDAGNSACINCPIRTA